MNLRPLLSKDDVMDPRMVEVLRGKTPAERYATVNGMWRSAHGMYPNLIRAEHPDWSEERVNTAVGQRLSQGAW